MVEDIINVPAHIDDMRIDKLSFLLERTKFPKSKNDISIVDKCKLNSMFTQIELSKMKQYSSQANKDLFNTIEDCYETYEPKAIPLELEYEGKKFTLRIDFTQHPVDWADDLQQAQDDFINNPIDLVSFMYIEEGLSYGEADPHQNVLNPRSVRNEIFAKHLPLSTYLDIQGFFLASWNVVRLYLTVEKSKLRKKERSMS
jgi:hypothetical protein